MLNPDTFLLRGASDRLFLNRDVSASRFFFIRPDECLSVLYGVVTDVSDGFRVWQTRGRCCRVLVVFELAPSVRPNCKIRVHSFVYNFVMPFSFVVLFAAPSIFVLFTSVHDVCRRSARQLSLDPRLSTPLQADLPWLFLIAVLSTAIFDCRTFHSAMRTCV